MSRRTRLLATLSLALLAWGPAGSALAQRSSTRALTVRGDTGLRPFLGATGDLGLDSDPGAEPTTGDKFVWGADLILGPATGLSWVLGAHLGAGQGDFMIQPLVAAHYRFQTPLRLVPWLGGGASLKLGFGGNEAFNLALTFRFDAGVEWWLNDKVAISTQLTLPDIGPRFLPDTVFGIEPIGTVEWIIGPHIRI